MTFISTGFPEALAACSAATNFPGCQAGTRGSFHPATPMTAGYRTPGTTCATPSISYRARHSTGSLTVPNSGMFVGPFDVNSRRIAFAHPTLHTAAANRSGLSVMARLMRIPPALVPVPASLWGRVKPALTRYSAHEMKSFQVFGLVVLKPALYQASPFSLPPRGWALATTTPRRAMELRMLKWGG